MGTDVATVEAGAELLERVVIGGDLSKLTPTERLRYYREVCASLGLNPLTRPLEYLHLNGKLILYARRDATDQLRKLHGISVEPIRREVVGDLYEVEMRATLGARIDSDLGAVSIAGLKGEALANAKMKAHTKAKRRVTLSICGLGMLDETEVETIPDARPAPELEAPDPRTPPTEAEILVSDYVARFDEATTRDEANGWLERWQAIRATVPAPAQTLVQAAINRARKRLP